jgi:hypothetical protein
MDRPSLAAYRAAHVRHEDYWEARRFSPSLWTEVLVARCHGSYVAETVDGRAVTLDQSTLAGLDWPAPLEMPAPAPRRSDVPTGAAARAVTIRITGVNVVAPNYRAFLAGVAAWSPDPAPPEARRGIPNLRWVREQMDKRRRYFEELADASLLPRDDPRVLRAIAGTSSVAPGSGTGTLAERWDEKSRLQRREEMLAVAKANNIADTDPILRRALDRDDPEILMRDPRVVVRHPARDPGTDGDSTGNINVPMPTGRPRP